MIRIHILKYQRSATSDYKEIEIKGQSYCQENYTNNINSK